MAPQKVTKAAKSSAPPTLSSSTGGKDMMTQEGDKSTLVTERNRPSRTAGGAKKRQITPPRQMRNKPPFPKSPRKVLPNLMELSVYTPVEDLNNNRRGLPAFGEGESVQPPLRQGNLAAKTSAELSKLMAKIQVPAPTPDKIEVDEPVVQKPDNNAFTDGEPLEDDDKTITGDCCSHSGSADSTTLAANDFHSNLGCQNNNSADVSCKDGAWANWDVDGVKLSDMLRLQYQSMLQEREQRIHWEYSRGAPCGMEATQYIQTYILPESEWGTAAGLPNSQSSSPAQCEDAQPRLIPGGPTMAPAIIFDPTGTMHVKPSLFIVPYRAINFTSIYIQFSIQVFNLPQHISISHQMFEVVTETPSGKLIVCMLKKDQTPLVFGGSASNLETFVGSFRATEEVGSYSVRARLVLPLMYVDKYMARFHSDFGVTGDTVDVLVSKNYFRDSKKVTGISFQLDLKTLKGVQLGENVISSKVWGLTCDKQTNRLYYTERVGNRVTCIEPSGRVLFRFNQNSAESRLNKPTGICCDAYHRRLLVCDKDHHRICFFTMDGNYISSFGTHGYKSGFLNYPWDLDVNPDGSKIVVADSRNKRIQLFDDVGNFLCKYSIFEQNPFEYKKHFDYPRGVSFDADGSYIYVTDFNTQNIIKVPSDFSSSRRLVTEGRLMRPQGIAVDDVGSLLVADSRSNCVYNLSNDGQVLSVIRSIGSSLVQYPVNLTILSTGQVAVLDGNGRIYIF